MGFLFMSKVIPRKANTHPVERSFQGVLTVAAEVGWLLPFSLQFITRLAVVYTIASLAMSSIYFCYFENLEDH